MLLLLVFKTCSYDESTFFLRIGHATLVLLFSTPPQCYSINGVIMVKCLDKLLTAEIIVLFVSHLSALNCLFTPVCGSSVETA